MVLGWILLATIATGILSVLAASFIAYSLARRFIPYLVSYAVGVLLAAAFLDLLPEAAATLPLRSLRILLMTTLASIFACFVLEKVALWHHTHPSFDLSARRQLIKPAGPMILIGDGLHNFTDGILLAAAFMTDARLGMVTTLAVVVHEIPREMGDFGVLVDAGFSWREALFWNVVFSLAAIAGGIVGFVALSIAQPAIPFVIAIAAGSFIYIAIADLVPGLHEVRGARAGIIQSGAIAGGVATLAAAVAYLH
jgi:zinc and cadmium transporter